MLSSFLDAGSPWSEDRQHERPAAAVRMCRSVVTRRRARHRRRRPETAVILIDDSPDVAQRLSVVEQAHHVPCDVDVNLSPETHAVEDQARGRRVVCEVAGTRCSYGLCGQSGQSLAGPGRTPQGWRDGGVRPRRACGGPLEDRSRECVRCGRPGRDRTAVASAPDVHGGMLLRRSASASGSLRHADEAHGRGDRCRRPWFSRKPGPIPRFPLHSHIDSR
jgi:hypothetical protein